MNSIVQNKPLEILMIEDNPGDILLAQEALCGEALRSNLSVAHDGFEALAFLRREDPFAGAPRPDIILLDLNMPRKDGRETLAEIKRDPNLKCIPVVIMTSSEREQSLLEHFQLSPDCYLTKPFDLSHFSQLLSSLEQMVIPAETIFPAARLAEQDAEERIAVLMLEDNPGDAFLLEEYLGEARGVKFDITQAARLSEAKARLSEREFDIILLDLSLLDSHGLDTLRRLHEHAADIPIVVITGNENENQGRQAVQLGAQDYLVKGDLSCNFFARSLQFAVERHRRRLLEAQLLHAQKMEGIGRLAGGVAHDFNNILTAILGYADLAGTIVSRGSEESGYLNNIEKAAQRAAALTRQLLAFARKQIIAPKTLQLNSLLQDMDELLSRLLSADIELVTRMTPELGAVKADPTQIEQILMNLAVNARDAMPRGGTLLIETANVGRSDSPFLQSLRAPAEEYVSFSVRDTGEGMTEAVKAHIFEPFFTTKEQGKGTGLGLATCYGIVKQSGGYISVDSEPGQGTTFTVFFPRIRETPVSVPTETRQADPPAAAGTVLLVEDEDSIRALLSHTLKKQGYSVLQAGNGSEALKTAEAFDGRIDLLITDVVMPYMGGKELAARLLALRPDLKVLFMSGHTEDTILLDGIEQEAAAFLQKPFMPAHLARRVQAILAD